ncbi:GNAT family N-acetyltransferase [Streptomyces mobaraensis NBRC 13819 = DSM 40847]|uniref:N-acetyltransferase GCN5 n=1 Tax=Streptomyces mobaraensis (strain ATCC 29032 / DSM 40847 / JCM 4168 / NBRC 13819 / NCIMB 11159 / IPCR 16-22) TaxID=1223523 RepID=M3A094_STRM1|nr:bifunctional GNAT family N-acetyltransferase/acetate--CoA ligase family protein [Streptomyces mobaraensis]EME98433.1 N-acetyltransferase GCN5 [Streptomyces mobaraensis NBRC 13819 = DSM 40847]QTT76110.1 GNAT family N-acetyltransferase [Streptomyces mobaraensis NBRC 13819 = DSM 40847]
MQTPSEHAYPAHWEADVVLRDGGTTRVRPITPDDVQRLVSFYEQVSDESKYYRFFAPYPRLSDRDLHRFTHHDYNDRVGLAATIGGEFIATVRYDRIDSRGRPAHEPTDEAEVAFLVQDAHQGRGVASALLEHIAAVARERGIRRFAAEVLPANTKMIKVFTDAGYTQKRSFEDGVVRLELDLEPTDRSLAVQRAREQRAEARSVQRLLAPGSVAVFGTGREPGGMGRAVLRNLLAGGFTGRVLAVNTSFPDGLTRLDPEGVPALRSLREAEGPVDLAVVAVPADRVPSVVEDCGEHGVQGLVVLSAGFAEGGADGRARQRELVRQARSYGMRIIGPNSFGLVNTAAGVRLNASLAPELPPPGRVGLFSQSGAIGIALLSGLQRRAAGLAGLASVSTFVSTGNRADVSGNDFLQYWHDDPDTDVALMYLESIGNPRKFTRLARRTALHKPVVVVKGARHGGVTPAGHTVPTTRMPDATVSHLLRQAGVIRVDTVTELSDTGLLLAAQPLPAGPRVAILGNSQSLALLTYDACLTDGLRPLPPRDLTTAAGPEDFHRALAAALADPACDAVVVTAIPRVDGESAAGLAAALRDAVAAAPVAKPVCVVHLEIPGLAEALAAPPEAGAPARPGSVRVPAYPAAERAARSLAHVARYAEWRRRTEERPGRVPEYEDIDEAGAAADIEVLLTAHGVTEGDPGGPRAVTLSAADTQRLLARYGIAVLPALPAPDPEAAVAAAHRLGFPVALKPTAPHLRHRADLGGVRLDLGGEAELLRAYSELTELLGKPSETRLVVQSMAPRGVDTVVRATIDPAAGAVLSFGLAGAPSLLLGDTAHCLVPATDRDAAELIRSVRTAPLLFGWRGAAPVDTGALEELLLRVSRLMDDHPEVVGADLEPVIVAQHGIHVLGASIRLAPPPPRTDPGPRSLPTY